MKKHRVTWGDHGTVTVDGVLYSFMVYGGRWNLTRLSDGARFVWPGVEFTGQMWPA